MPEKDPGSKVLFLQTCGAGSGVLLQGKRQSGERLEVVWARVPGSSVGLWMRAHPEHGPDPGQQGWGPSRPDRGETAGARTSGGRRRRTKERKVFLAVARTAVCLCLCLHTKVTVACNLGAYLGGLYF